MPLPLPRVDISASSHTNSTVIVPLSGQDAREVVLIHEVVLLAHSAALLCGGSNILLLVFRQDQFRSPATLTTTSLPLSIGGAVYGLRNTETIAAVVPLHVLFQVHLELSIRVCRAGDTSERVLAAAGTKLLVHVLGGEETGMAALDERLQMADSLQSGSGEQVQVHLQQHVLALYYS